MLPLVSIFVVLLWAYVVVSETVGLVRTVDIRPQAGVTITSAHVVYGSEPSEYFRYMYVKFRDPGFTNPELFPPQLCSLQFLGFYNGYSREHDTHMPVFPLRHTGVPSNQTEGQQAHVEVQGLDGSIIRLMCYVQQFAARRLKSARGHEYVAFLAYFCPMMNRNHCTVFNRREIGGQSAHSLNVSVTTAYHHNGRMNGFRMDDLKPSSQLDMRIRVELVNYFLMNVLPTLPSPIGEELSAPSVGVVTTIGYAPEDSYRREVMRVMTSRWLDHYRRLNMRVVVHDSAGFRPDWDGMEVVDYRNYSVFSLLGMFPLEHDGDHSRGYDPSKEYRYELHKFYDIDKSATFTHTRFELAALFQLEAVLTVDFDEFLYCANSFPEKRSPKVDINTYPGQIEVLRRLIAARQDKEILLADFVPRKRVEEPIQECLMNAAAEGRSIFNCVSDMSEASINSPKLKKALHTKIRCPFTHFHGSCVELRYDVAYECECARYYPPATQCAVVHFEFKVKNRYKLNLNASANNMVFLA